MSSGELYCSDLTKVYSESGGKRALDSVSLTTPSRGILALIGMNGAGKTTLVRILATQLEPTSGTAQIDGVDVVKEPKKLRERIATVPQEARPVPWMTPLQTVVSYLLWRGVGYSEARRRGAEAIGRVGLDDQGTKLNRRLSGGQRRKVLVATALAADAEITFLDEPTTGLDPLSRRELWRSLHGRLAGVGTLDQLRSLVKHQYSIRLPSSPERPPVTEGTVTTGRDGEIQVLTSEEEAYRISRELLERGVRFSVNRISLDDVFFHLVGSTGVPRQ
ncbi:MAG: ABC transporter ATP-binding protein [Thaumarchaeota archaeon]|nr:MAG: ABC transporter ATP-binding protein [Nitrososphaerota archaeon]